MKILTEKWIQFARADLEASEVQIKYGAKRGSSYQVAVFHCHQAIEKMFKAYLVEQDQEIKKIHDLTMLRTLVKIDIPEEYIEIIDELQPHYLIPRYPDLPFSPQFSFTYNKKNTEDIFNKTRRLFIWLGKKLTQEK